MENIDIKNFIKIKCIENNIKVKDLANKLGMSRQLMWHHVLKKNIEILEKIGNILNISKDKLKKF
ncbi:HTH cro/C1-type domain-containing protein [Fusobacterium necrophorum subsp. funduliforme]|uniref:hypothetical protein n=1 Tax=Fusobacterium necrophorum TaxID=859 RepID=UPI0007896F68|nr:hypothetical protein [Fusobacterium necrophorum]AVQ20685.1 hypothetical protein C4N15_03120 [Fusobacterium necrophorum subsp. funduliforme]AYV94366.1 hypothetical protein BWX37_01500 [Fusobacterium necrophorum subsp. funduliforme]KYL04285.1 hypothetical protein A2J06_01385 [Fusobacterium necrophorum subsp. funduliforme]KYM51120.1 hypothetical protein A2U04_01900 [Fusobacterium necrophorum subsp. funduliforme]MCI7343700.1 hypothetical protein [Fusobacterium necrophorum]